VAKSSAPHLSDELELVDNYGSLIREARREAGLSHEDLGRKIREKTSVLRKIETGRMTPDHPLAQKLEHALQMQLLVPTSEPRVSRTHLSKPHKPTLGDIVHLKKEKLEEPEKREQS
jgi:putative transcription factor